MSMSIDSDERLEEPSRAFQRGVRGVVCAVRVLCVMLFVVLGVLCYVLCAVSCVLCVLFVVRCV